MKPDAQRDDGLRRISSLTRWMAAAAVVVGGVFTAAVARAVPGHAKATSTITSGDSDDSDSDDVPGGPPAGAAVPATPSTTVPAPRLSPGTQAPSAGSSQGTLTPPRSRVSGGRGRGSVSSGSS